MCSCLGRRPCLSCGHPRRLDRDPSTVDGRARELTEALDELDELVMEHRTAERALDRARTRLAAADAKVQAARARLREAAR